MEPFVAAYKNAVLGNYANFNGRLSVGGYWRFAGIQIAILIVLSILGGAASIFTIVLWLYYLATIVPMIAAAVRRMHDTDRAGWMVIIPIASLIWSFQAGTPGDNKYGPVPAT